ncbi:MAG: diaminopimelate decarboxylase, partial [Nitrospira sp.]|nr:diaminopimelate decarboxylase [Nitrospira sp.]
YEAYHEIQPVLRQNRSEQVVDVVGPICESGDFLAKDRSLAECLSGELLAVMSAGAYGFSMASNYNARPRAAEVLVHGDRYEVIREREGLEDLTHGERIPSFLK